MTYLLIIIIFLLSFIIYQKKESTKNQRNKDQENIKKEIILKNFPHLYGVESPLYNNLIIEDYFDKFRNSIELPQLYSDNQSEITNIIDQLYIDFNNPEFFNIPETERPYFKGYIEMSDKNLIKLNDYLKNKNVTHTEMWFIKWLYINDLDGQFRFEVTENPHGSGVFDAYPNTLFKRFLNSFNEILLEKNKN